MDDLNVQGCASPVGTATMVQLITPNAHATGSYTDGNAVFNDGNANIFTSVPGKYALVLGQLGPVGQTIEGKFQVVVMAGGASHELSGSFEVCRVPDEDLP
jgi:hypothetical protein